MTDKESLALLGGSPVIAEPLPPYVPFGEEEYRAVEEVMRRGILSGFLGSFEEGYLGGPVVRRLEEEWADRFSSRHAVSVNSATSGLLIALGAVGLSPGDEVVVPPFTMSATAVAPLFYGGIPIFADIEADTFTIDPREVAARLTPRTRAVVAVNLFGHPARLAELRRLCDERNIFLIEDNAQAPLAAEGNRLAGTIGHIGVFSLNVHKHIQSGEGGICVTDDDDLAVRLQLIRNHGENAAGPLGIDDLTNLVGLNLRMTELTAAVALEQLRRADHHVGRRVETAEALTKGLSGLEGIVPPVVRDDCRHVYYIWACRLEEDALGVPRDRFSEALLAEGFPHFTGYVEPLYRLPLFRNRIAVGRGGWPFTLGAPSYEGPLCPVAEEAHERKLLCFEPCAHAVNGETIEDLITAFRKVHSNRSLLVKR